jgi:hypothetical protein
MQENRWAYRSNLTTSSIIANQVKGGMARLLYHLWDNSVFESPLTTKQSQEAGGILWAKWKRFVGS